MQKRALGNGGPQVGVVGLGCMSFGGDYGATSVAESFAVLDAAAESGVTILDIANIYGKGVSEETVGAYLSTRNHPFVLATKAGIVPVSPRRYDNSAAYLRECLEASLKRLKRDHVELFYVHRREAERPIEEVMEAMVRFKEEGKIGAIGLSEVAPSTLERASAVHPVAAVQNEYSLWTRLPELGMLQACQRLGTAFVAFSPLGRGVFTSKMPDPAAFSPADFRVTSPRFTEPNFSHNAERIARFRAFAQARGVSPAALALAWVLAKAPNIIAIPGTRSAAHMSENASAGDIVLTPADVAEIEEVLPVGFAHGDRYSDERAIGPERYC